MHEPGSAQRDGFDEPGVSRQHSGCAVVPAGTSVGHGPEAHDGESRRRISDAQATPPPAELIKYTAKVN